MYWLKKLFRKFAYTTLKYDQDGNALCPKCEEPNLVMFEEDFEIFCLSCYFSKRMNIREWMSVVGED